MRTRPNPSPPWNRRLPRRLRPATAHPIPIERLEQYRAFRRAFDAGDFAAAKPLAEQVVTVSEQQFGADARELVNPLSNLGATHYRLGDFAAAESAFVRAVRIVDGQASGADRSLIRPLQGLGEAYLATRRFAEGAIALKRAVDLMRNLDGLFNVEQLETLDSLIESYVGLDRLQDAEKETQYAFRVAESAYGRDDLRMLEPLDRHARWFEFVGRYTTARGLHARALQLCESRAGRDSVLAVDALRGLARTYYLEFIYGPEDAEAASSDVFSPSISATGPEGRLNPDGERALRIALESLARANPPDRRARSATLVELGDWYLIGGNIARAVETYKEGWTDAVAAGGERRICSARPGDWRIARPASRYRAPRRRTEEFEERFVEARFAVGRDGKVTDVSTASTDAPAEREVLLAVRKARYAPRLENGETVDTPGVTLRERVLVRRGTAAPAPALRARARRHTGRVKRPARLRATVTRGRIRVDRRRRSRRGGTAAAARQHRRCRYCASARRPDRYGLDQITGTGSMPATPAAPALRQRPTLHRDPSAWQRPAPGTGSGIWRLRRASHCEWPPTAARHRSCPSPRRCHNRSA